MGVTGQNISQRHLILKQNIKRWDAESSGGYSARTEVGSETSQNGTYILTTSCCIVVYIVNITVAVMLGNSQDP